MTSGTSDGDATGRAPLMADGVSGATGGTPGTTDDRVDDVQPEPPPAVFARLAAALILGWLALGVWGYSLALRGDARGVIAPVVQIAAAFTAYGLRTEPSLRRWRSLLTGQAAALALIGGMSAVSLLTVAIAD